MTARHGQRIELRPAFKLREAPNGMLKRCDRQRKWRPWLA
jgi:hypothetical protein